MAKKLTAAAILAKAKLKRKSRYHISRVSAAASSLGTLGGLAGGPARADALTPERRSEIAAFAANIRWGNIKKSEL